MLCMYALLRGAQLSGEQSLCFMPSHESCWALCLSTQRRWHFSLCTKMSSVITSCIHRSGYIWVVCDFSNWSAQSRRPFKICLKTVSWPVAGPTISLHTGLYPKSELYSFPAPYKICCLLLISSWVEKPSNLAYLSFVYDKGKQNLIRSLKRLLYE